MRYSRMLEHMYVRTYDLFFSVDKKCVSDCIGNMQNSTDLSPLEIVEMFVTVFCFLKDSSEVSCPLPIDIKNS